MSKVLSYKTAKKYAHLKCHMEKTELEVATKDGKYKADVMTKAGSKGARKAMGTLRPGDMNGVYRGNCSHVMSKDKKGNTRELDVRGLEENFHKKQGIGKAQVKEAIKFRAGIIEHKLKMYVWVNRVGQNVIKRMATIMVEQGVHQHDMWKHNPYKNGDYKAKFTDLAQYIACMEFKTH